MIAAWLDRLSIEAATFYSSSWPLNWLSHSILAQGGGGNHPSLSLSLCTRSKDRMAFSDAGALLEKLSLNGGNPWVTCHDKNNLVNFKCLRGNAFISFQTTQQLFKESNRGRCWHRWRNPSALLWWVVRCLLLPSIRRWTGRKSHWTWNNTNIWVNVATVKWISKMTRRKLGFIVQSYFSVSV